MIARVKSLPVRKRAAIFAVWIATCAVLFVALSDAEDPSRRRDRILSNEAAERAMRIAVARPELTGYEVVHVAFARAAEGGAEARWVVLLDRAPRTAMRDAVVIELRAGDGKLLGIRKPRV